MDRSCEFEVQCARIGGFRPCGIGARVPASVFFSNDVSVFVITFFYKKTRKNDKIKTYPRRDEIENIVKTGGKFSEIKIVVIFFAPHGVKGIDNPVRYRAENRALVGKKKKREAEPEKACKRAVEGIFRKAFDACADYVRFFHFIGVSAHNAGKFASRLRHVVLCKFLLYRFDMLN